MTKRQIRVLLRKCDAVQMNQIWMRVGHLDFSDKDGAILGLEPTGSGVASRRFVWEQLIKARVENADELVLKDGTRLKFFKLQPMQLHTVP